MLATGSLDKSIKVWSIKDAKLLQTMHGHLKGVWCMRFLTRNLLCSGSYDFSIKIWNLLTFTCSRTLYSHTGPVWQICISQSCLISASKDRTAKVWDMTCCTVLFTLYHKEPVYCVDAQDNVIVTGSGDQLLKLWDKSTGVCYKTIYLGTKDILTGVSLDRGYIAVSSNQLILVLKIEKKGDKINAEEIQRYKEHLKRIESIRLKMIDPAIGDGLIISGSQDGFIKYYDIAEPKSVHTFDVHDKRSINCIYFDDYIIASASGDNHIKILNFAVPNVVKNSEPVNQSQEEVRK